ncbi:MAG: proline--tRNA ligase, partial [Sulfurimonadaceae bacterium]|nr:proline--tRNA ligase [Sulfurimonadaceae bacterium]
EAAKRSGRASIPEAPVAEFNKFKTPMVKTIDDLAGFFKISSYYTIKCVAKRAIYEDDSEIVLFFLRGCDDLQEKKALNATGALDLVDVSSEELEELGLVPGFMGPLDQIKAKHVIDNDLIDATAMVCGANELDYHYVGVCMSVLKDGYFADIAEVNEGDICPHCDGTLSFTKGIEVGHIFKLGTTYSAALKAEFLDENGKAKPFVMGTYGMGVSRLVAAIIEQHHDEHGCIWTKEVAPYAVNILISNIKDNAQVELAEELYKKFQEHKVTVMLDDRKERFGFKMNDAELIGFPFTIIIGKELENNEVEIYERKSKEKTLTSKENVFEKIMEYLA